MKHKHIRVSEVLHLFHAHSSERISVFKSLPAPVQAQVLLGLSKKVQALIIKELNQNEIVNILEQVDPDKARNFLRLLGEKEREKILQLLSERMRQVLELLLEFDPDTAAGLMHLDYILIDADSSMKKAHKDFKKYEKYHGRVPIMVVMKNSKVKGSLPAYKFHVSNEDDFVSRHVHVLPKISYDVSKKEIINIFRSHPHEKLLVMGQTGNVIGVIFSDDVLRILREKEAESLYDFAGVNKEENVLDPAWYKVKSRYKWLIINLGTAFMASFTVSLFDETISKYVMLAVYMPIVAGMGGNSATQTLAIMVRGIALKQITLKTVWPTLRNELTSSFVNGIINGLIVALIVILFNQDLKLALVLAMAMIINLLVAGLFGTLIPLVMQRLGKDPASSATIFITTATDVLGFIAFLGLATLILA